MSATRKYKYTFSKADLMRTGGKLKKVEPSKGNVVFSVCYESAFFEAGAEYRPLDKGYEIITQGEAFTQLQKDAHRSYLVNGKKYLGLQEGEHANTEKALDAITRAFGADLAKKFVLAHTQTSVQLHVMVLWHSFSNDLQQRINFSQDDNQTNNYYVENGEIYLEAKSEILKGYDNNNGNKVDLPAPIYSKYKLVGKKNPAYKSGDDSSLEIIYGYELISISTDNDLVARALKGEKLSDNEVENLFHTNNKQNTNSKKQPITYYSQNDSLRNQVNEIEKMPGAAKHQAILEEVKVVGTPAQAQQLMPKIRDAARNEMKISTGRKIAAALMTMMGLLAMAAGIVSLGFGFIPLGIGSLAAGHTLFGTGLRLFCKSEPKDEAAPENKRPVVAPN